ncbi:MAG: 3-ketoacyl-ACP reductase [Planctomycetota bacterium]|nr:MAG: 3-ketoacyl-ACP reductase [Planctomycetota bacterium]
MQDSRVALVTGGSRGIGRGVCIELARLGYAVVINFRKDFTAAEEARAECERCGSPAVELCQGDVTTRSHRDLIVEFVMERFGRIDLLVNNAGVAPESRYDILSTPEDSFDRVMKANLKAPYFLTQRVANEMVQLREQGLIDWAAIVNVSSIRSYTAAANYGEYCLSKAGVSMMTKLFAVRLAPLGIYVYEVCPGLIQTDMTSAESTREFYNKKLAAGLTPINRWGTPEEVGRAVAAIARQDYPFSTGQVFHVDGGWHVREL